MKDKCDNSERLHPSAGKTLLELIQQEQIQPEVCV